jgi:SAM-dependent methyltransferase
MSEPTKSSYVVLDRCLACGGDDLRLYLDLGTQPLANAFAEELDAAEQYPLALNVCGTCWHSQLTVAVDPEILFRDYVYVSGTTAASTTYFEAFADEVTTRFGSGRRILEIASNDGSLLSALNARGHSTLGVDPAANLASVAAARGVNTLASFWPSNLVEHLRPGYDVVIAMNVFAHVPDPLAFLSAIAELLDDSSVVLIQTSQARMVENIEFDTAYHEHLSFFNCSSMNSLAERAGLELRDMTYKPVHGTSYLWELGRPTAGAARGASLEQAWLHEQEIGLFDEATYAQFAEKAIALGEQTVRSVDAYRAKGFRILGYGAAAKGNTFINFSGVELEAIIDANPRKQRLKSPGGGVPVIAPEDLAEIDEACAFLIPAWNYREEICEHIRRFHGRSGDVAIVYYPEFEEFSVDV